MNRPSNKGFTLIELIVVMAIIGILVLLATPKFLNYIELANVTRIKHDTKVTEDLIITYMVKNNSQFPEEVIKTPIEIDRLNKLLTSGDIYSKEGLIDKDGNITINDGYFKSSSFNNISFADSDHKDIRDNVNFNKENYFVIKKSYIKSEVKSRLKGEFIVDKNARVLYVNKLDAFEDLYEEDDPETELFTIVYHSNGALGSAPKDNNKYKYGEDATILGPGSLIKEDHQFYCWEDKDGNIFNPEDSIKVKKDLDLYAAWEYVESPEPPPGGGGGGSGGGGGIEEPEEPEEPEYPEEHENPKEPENPEYPEKP